MRLALQRSDIPYQIGVALIKRAKLDYLDVFRAFSILAVLLIHTTSTSTVKLPTSNVFYPIYQIANAGSHFAVPSFLFLSALVMFYNYFGRKGINWFDFFRKRLLSIVIPYVLWSVIYFLFVTYASHASISDRLPNFWKGLWLGTNYTHLYFIIIIIQFYVLFPIMLGMAQSRIVRSLFVPLGIALQLAFYLLNYYSLHMTKTGTFFGSYLLFFFIGAWAGIHLQTKPNWLSKRNLPLYAAFVVLGAFYVGEMWELRLDPSYLPLPYRSYVNFLADYSYSAVCCLLLIHVSRALYAVRGLFSRLFVSLGAVSFGVYFIHPLFLYVWRREIGSAPTAHLTVWAGGAVALLLSWAITYVVQQFKLGVYVVGNVNKPSAAARPAAPNDGPGKSLGA